uniref:Ovule protein n=1 Tax=Parascaris univalens TaxID=6257 RepID=A0A914ZM36_PARUN
MTIKPQDFFQHSLLSLVRLTLIACFFICDEFQIAAGADIHLVQMTKVIEGDTMVIQFRANRKAQGMRER